jgi:uncharacterized protein YheU (UPF0270 family)
VEDKMTKIYRVKLSELKKAIKESSNILDLQGIVSTDKLNLEVLKNLLEDFTGSTYPENILERRINLLNKLERARVLQNWNDIHKALNIIDDTISKRAEIEKDPWE